MEKVQNLLIGGGGMALVDQVPTVTSQMQMDAPNLVTVIVQIFIGIVTLIGIFKKPKPVIP